ncbi:MAG: DNA gyrase inhibitor YacG [Deltaproteobacteria bacterium CG11_big_fil_rev_8_21_14_0_20_49_13]|nr:MAG: DNA gyrase inhibitor YacG [Deltaproteobacteria bacterium CG11_big_fil_rev_8_21_14_0_20_49_13]
MQKTRPCPYCKKPVDWDESKWRPFCSERCKMIDLGHWAMGSYRLAGNAITGESSEAEADDNVEDEKRSV